MTPRIACTIGAALLSAACSTPSDNPFQGLSEMHPPPAAADLVVVSSGFATAGSGVRDVFAVDIDVDGGAPAQLTTCVSAASPCDVIEVAPSPTERQRIIVRRLIDSNGDGSIEPGEREALFSMDLSRGLEQQILTTMAGVSGIQWSTLPDTPLIFSAIGAGGLEDIYDAAVDGTNPLDLSNTADVRERQPRLVAPLLTYEKAAQGARSEIWLSSPGAADARLTTGNTTLSPLPLPGTNYLMGSDADPDPSPDAQHVVFRRLMSVGDGRGNWDILVADNTSVQAIAAGGAYRGAPDWGAKGIVFVESAEGSATADLITPDGARRVLTSGPAATLQSPRWLP